jgi:hypothetical protein
VWLEDIEQRRSRGCDSPRCRNKFEASGAVRELLTTWVERDRTALYQLADAVREKQQRASLRRMADDLYGERLTEIDAAISDWLMHTADDEPTPFSMLRGSLSHG